MEIDFSTPHPPVTAQVRAGIEAHKATKNVIFGIVSGPLPSGVTAETVEWEAMMGALPADGVTYVVEGESRV